MANRTKQLNLVEARELAPSVDPTVALQRNLAFVLFDTVKEMDVAEIVNGLVAEAKKGDKKAAALLLNVITKAGQGSAAPTTGPKVIREPVLIDTPAKKTLRRLVALHIHVNGPSPINVLAELVGLGEPETAALLDSDWFASNSQGVCLTPSGRSAVG